MTMRPLTILGVLGLGTAIAISCGPFYGIREETELTCGPSSMLAPLRTSFDMELIAEFKDRMVTREDAEGSPQRIDAEKLDVETTVRQAARDNILSAYACAEYLRSLKAEREEAIGICEKIAELPKIVRGGLGALAHYRAGRLLMGDLEKWAGEPDDVVKARIRRIKAHFLAVGEGLAEGDVRAGGIALRWKTWHAHCCSMLLPPERLLLLGEADFAGAFRAYIAQPEEGSSNAVNSCHRLIRNLAQNHQYGVCVKDPDLKKLMSIYLLSGGYASDNTAYEGVNNAHDWEARKSCVFSMKQWLRILKENGRDPGIGYGRFAAMLYMSGDYDECGRVLSDSHCDPHDPLVALIRSRIKLRDPSIRLGEAMEDLSKALQPPSPTNPSYSADTYELRAKYGFPNSRKEWLNQSFSFQLEPSEVWDPSDEVERLGFAQSTWTNEAVAAAYPIDFIQMNFTYAEGLRRRVRSELATALLLKGDFMSAAFSLWEAGRSKDFAYVAECIMDVDELKTLVDARWPDNFYPPRREYKDKLEEQVTFLTMWQDPRTLLARRLWRAGRYDEAVPYIPRGQRHAAKHIARHMNAIKDTKLKPETRAEHCWLAAGLLAQSRIDPLFCEFGQSWTVYNDLFWHDSPQHPFFRSVFMKKYPLSRERYEYKGDPNAFFVPSDEERKRLTNWMALNMEKSDLRHRSEGMEPLRLCMEAASLLPDNDPRGAHMLQWGGNLIRYTHPKGAVPAYRMLVKRFGNTSLGKHASATNWLASLWTDFDPELFRKPYVEEFPPPTK